MPEAPADIRYVAKNMRLDLRLIAEMIPAGAKVLDIGCGDGALIDHLAREKQADARGIEIDMAEVTKAVSAGLAVIHGDADNDLAMLRYAGTSVVPANGLPQARELASFLTDSCDDDGIARAIEELVLH